MSEENVEVVREMHEAYNRGGPEAVLPFLDPEVEWRDPPDLPEARVYHGHEGFLEAQRNFLEPFEKFTATPEELRDLGDEVLMVGRARGHGAGSGAEFTQEVASVWTLREGKVVLIRFFRNLAEALDAAWLSE